MNYAIDFAPHVPLAILWLLACVAGVLVLYAFLMQCARRLGAGACFRDCCFWRSPIR